MNRLAVVLVIILLAGSACAEEGQATVKRDYSVNVGEAQLMDGIVESVTPSDVSKPNAKIIIRDDKGVSFEFSVKPSALVFTSSGGQLLTLKDVAAGDKVTINYRVKGDINEAVAVKVAR